MAKGELITLGAAATAIGGAYKLGEFLHKAKRLRDVGPANAVYVRIIGRVSSDLDEVRRLLAVREVHDALESNPEKSKWVYGVMRDVRGALENIAPHTERVASDVEDGRRIGIRHRLYWLLSEQEKLENREKEVQIAHASLGEVIGYLTALEPVEEPKHGKSSSKKEKEKEKETRVDVDIERDGPHRTTERVDREVWVDREAGPRRVEHFEEHHDVYIDERERGPSRYEERDVHIERERNPPRYEERDVQFERERGPSRYEEREVHVERERGLPRYEERDIHIERERGPHHYEERDIHIERSREPRDPRYEAQYDERYEQQDYYERRPQYPEERLPEDRYPEPRRPDERPFPEPLGRRPESFEDRLPERDTWMQSNARTRSRPSQYGPYGEYAEYGAPQPVGAAHYKRRFQGDAGFGDEEILNPAPVPLDRKYAEREVWIEQKEDYRFDEYGNRLPDRYFQPPVPRPYRSRM